MHPRSLDGRRNRERLIRAYTHRVLAFYSIKSLRGGRRARRILQNLRPLVTSFVTTAISINFGRQTDQVVYEICAGAQPPDWLDLLKIIKALVEGSKALVK